MIGVEAMVLVFLGPLILALAFWPVTIPAALVGILWARSRGR